MQSIDDFVKEILECRELIDSGKYDDCPCTRVHCEWHGNCRECVMLHRVHQDHLPVCMQPMVKKIIRDLARVAEVDFSSKEGSPKEHWDYMKKNYPKDKK